MSENIDITVSAKPDTSVWLRFGLPESIPWQSDFVRKVAQTYVTQIFSLSLAVVSTIVIARSLGPAGRGLYAAAVAIGMLGVQFGNFGLNASNTYYLARDPRLVRSVLGNALMVSIGIGALGGIAGWVFFHVFPQLMVVPPALLTIGLIWIPVGLTYLFCQSMLVALHKVRDYNLIELANRCFTLLLVGLVIVSHTITPVRMMLAALCGQAIGTIWSYSKLSRDFEGLPRPSLETLREHLEIGFKAYLVMFFSFLALKSSVLIVKWLLGAEQTGYYSVAASMADYILLLPTTIGMILFPKLSAMRDETTKVRQATHAALGTALCLSPLLLLAALLSRLAVRLLFGPAFLPAADAFIWLLPGIFSLGVEIVLVQFLNSIGYPAIIIWSWILSGAVNIVLSIYAIPRFGIAGAAAVASLTYVLTLLIVAGVIKFHWYSATESPEALHGY